MSQQNGVFELLISTMQAHTVALEANTAAILANGGSATPAPTSTKGTGGAKGGKNTKPEEKKPTHTKEETTAAVIALKDAAGAPAARDLLAAHGIDKVANVPAEKFDVVYDAAVAALEEFNASKGEETNDDDI